MHLMRRTGLAEFPDAVTARGAKHLDELAAMVAAGCRAVMLFLIQIGSAERFTLAADIDPTYARAFDRARAAGVEALAYRCKVTAAGHLPCRSGSDRLAFPRAAGADRHRPMRRCPDP